jgi:hypothetical protein
VNHDYVLGWDRKVFCQLGNRRPRLVHEAGALGQNQIIAGTGLGLRDYRDRFVGSKLDTQTACQNVQGHLTDVVAIGLVAGPGVTEPDH